MHELSPELVEASIRSGLDPAMFAALTHLASKGFEPAVVADIGAAKGYWSQGAGSIFRRAHFHMIDPLEESLPELRRVCEANERYHHLLCAVGDAPGEHRISLTPDYDGSTLLDYYEDGGQPTRVIRVETLDGLVSSGRIPAPDLVKIDVQGFEMKVIEGGRETLRAAEVAIIEVNMFRFMPECPLAHEVIAEMAALGFVIFDLAGALRRPFENDLGQMDLVFVRADSALVGSVRWA